ncbi:MAG: transporter substrate-binding protein [Solirubrobacterales bacterium]|jgi:putative hydroxymethylpyrimidine transport system substrate-binding protein|nr:transporter substrate-binding protein [Solirubrobacterales bacterium]
MKRPTALVLSAALALALGACGKKEDPSGTVAPKREKLTLVLDYFPNADHVGIYAAEATGAFERAGLDVDIRVPGDPSEPLKLVAAGRADLAISYEPELFLARDKGVELVGIGAIAQKPLTSIISLGSAKIRRPSDLDGKTVGTAGIPYQSAYLKTILEGAGVDPKRVKEVDVGFNLVPSLLSKKVDAVLGAFWNYEGIQLEREDKDPSIIRVEQAGVPTYDELILVADQEQLGKRGRVFRRFIQALRQGTEAVRADADAGLDPLLAANPDLERGLQAAVVKATLPVFFPEDPRRPFGWQDPEEWRLYGAWMRENELVENPPSQALLSNEFLPGEGVRPVEANPGEQGGE